MLTILKKNIFLLSFTTIIITFIGCSSDDPVAPQEEHFEAIGTVIYNSTGAEVVRILRGVTSDTLFAQVGVLSDHYNVKFIDEDEHVVNPPNDEDLSMGIDVANANLLEIEQDVQGEFKFHLLGIAEGITSIEIKILHAGHADYRSGNIPIRIAN